MIVFQGMWINPKAIASITSEAVNSEIKVVVRSDSQVLAMMNATDIEDAFKKIEFLVNKLGLPK